MNGLLHLARAAAAARGTSTAVARNGNNLLNGTNSSSVAAQRWIAATAAVNSK